MRGETASRPVTGFWKAAERARRPRRPFIWAPRRGASRDRPGRGPGKGGQSPPYLIGLAPGGVVPGSPQVRGAVGYYPPFHLARQRTGLIRSADRRRGGSSLWTFPGLPPAVPHRFSMEPTFIPSSLCNDERPSARWRRRHRGRPRSPRWPLLFGASTAQHSVGIRRAST